jgi:RHS repeat-associated protein
VATSGSTTTATVYVGGDEEVSTSGSTTTTTTYYAAGPVTAINVNGTLSYPVSDTLGSTTVALSASGGVQADQLFTPYGATRYSSGTMPTSYGFTRQRLDPSGLSYFNARYYDGVVGQFVSADSVQGPNRYAYVSGNPETLTDPTGKFGRCGGGALADGMRWAGRHHQFSATKTPQANPPPTPQSTSYQHFCDGCGYTSDECGTLTAKQCSTGSERQSRKIQDLRNAAGWFDIAGWAAVVIGDVLKAIIHYNTDQFKALFGDLGDFLVNATSLLKAIGDKIGGGFKVFTEQFSGAIQLVAGLVDIVNSVLSIPVLGDAIQIAFGIVKRSSLIDVFGNTLNIVQALIPTNLGIAIGDLIAGAGHLAFSEEDNVNSQADRLSQKNVAEYCQQYSCN